MHIILGATGHVGSAVAHALLARGEPVTAIVREPEKAAALRARGAELAVADVHDAAALRQVFARGKRLFLLNPPAAPSSDTDREERATVKSLLAALEGSGLEKIVAESTYGARAGHGIGDSGVLYELEQGLLSQPIPAHVLRGAYYMSNWDALLEPVSQQGKLESLYPPDFRFPMVAPHDIGEVAMRRMIEPAERTGLEFVEGPARHSVRDVAEVFAAALHRSVQPQEIPADQWPAWLAKLGFSEPAAQSFAGMTRLTLQGDFPDPQLAHRGSTSLQSYIAGLVAKAPA